MADEPATGTPGATSEGAATSSGTPDASQDGGGAATVDADELKKLRDIREQFLREKDNTERIRQENELLRQQYEQMSSRASMPPTGYDTAAQRQARAAQVLESLRERDPELVEALGYVAGATQEQLAAERAERERIEQQRRFDNELAGVPEADRAEVKRIAQAERLWPSLAHDRLEARRFAKERTELAEQRRKLQEQEDRLKRGVVSTTASPSPPASTNNGEVTAEEWARIGQAAGAGDVDAMKKVRAYDEGKLKIRSG